MTDCHPCIKMEKSELPHTNEVPNLKSPPIDLGGNTTSDSSIESPPPPPLHPPSSTNLNATRERRFQPNLPNRTPYRTPMSRNRRLAPITVPAKEATPTELLFPDTPTLDTPPLPPSLDATGLIITTTRPLSVLPATTNTTAGTLPPPSVARPDHPVSPPIHKPLTHVVLNVSPSPQPSSSTNNFPQSSPPPPPPPIPPHDPSAPTKSKGAISLSARDALRRTSLSQEKHGLRGSLMCVFVGIAICQVVLACVLIWWIGYRAITSSVSELRTDLRASTLHDCLNQIDRELRQTLRATHELRFMTQKRFPDMATRLTITDQDGWLADITAMESIFPRVARFGIFNSNSFIVAAVKPTSLTDRSTLSDTGRNSLFLAEPTSYNQTVLTLNSYVRKPIRPNPNYFPPYDVDGEIRNSDTVADIATYLGPIRSSVSYVTKQRSFWTDAFSLVQTGQRAGWTTPYFALGSTSQPGYVALLAFSAVVNNVTQEMDWATFAVMSATDLEPFLRSLPIGESGRAYLMRPNGKVSCTSDHDLSLLIQNKTTEIDMFTSDDPWLSRLLPLLLDTGLVTTEPVTIRNSYTVVPYRSTIYERDFSVSGDSYLMQAVMTTNSTSGGPFFVVIVTKDSDFDGNLRASIVTTGWLSAVVCVAAIVVSSLVTSCVTRPLMRVVHFMSRAVRVMEMNRGEDQRLALSTLCADWSNDTHTSPILSTATGGAIQEPESRVRMEANKSEACRLLCCVNVGRSLREVDLMHRSFGSMLYSLASYDELEAINQAKRQFIRYIFHEVRVPFNAIVLGIEQMQLDVRMHLKSNPHCSSLAPCLDTMSIVHEQGEVVSRILNDVLSMQKIEDGALTLEISSFDLEKMIRVALHAFRVPCAEKRLKVEMNCQSLDDLIEQSRQSIPILAQHPEIHLGQTKLMIQTGEQQQPDDQRTSNHDDGIWKAHIEADPYRLRQALANFVSNAIKFSRVEGCITVTLEWGIFVPALTTNSLLVAAGSLPILGSGGGGKLLANGDVGGRVNEGDEELPNVPMHSPGSATPLMDDNLPQPLRLSPKTSPEMKQIENLHLNIKTPRGDIDHDLDDAEGEVEFDSNSEYSGRYLGSVNFTVRVKDSGVGLSRENASKMFQQYAQISANKHQAGGGTGLGLSISKSIVELHGGQIGVTSVEGEGAEFYFTIPNTRVILSKVEGTTTNAGSVNDPVDSSSGEIGDILGIDTGCKESSTRSSRDGGTFSFTNVIPTNGTPSGVDSVSGTSTRRTSLDLRRAAAANALNGAPQIVPPLAIPASIATIDARVEARHSAAQSFVNHSGKGSGSSRNNAPPSPRTTTSIVRVHMENDAAATTGCMKDQIINNGAISPKRSDATNSRGALKICRAPSTDSNQSTSSVQLEAISTTDGNMEPMTTTGIISNGGDKSPGIFTNDQTFMVADSPPVTTNLSGSSTNSIPFTPDLSSASSSPELPLDQGGEIGATLPSSSTLSPSCSPPIARDETVASMPSSSPTPKLESTELTPPLLPVGSSSASSTGAMPKSSPGHSRGTSSLGSSSKLPAARVLVVEDSLPNRKLLISILQHMKLAPTGVENGLECVNLFPEPVPGQTTPTEQPFDVCIMDGNMPVMNGVEACRILRARGVTIPILALTGNALAEDVTAFTQAGATSVLTKPVNRAQLLAALQIHLPQLKVNKK